MIGGALQGRQPHRCQDKGLKADWATPAGRALGCRSVPCRSGATAILTSLPLALRCKLFILAFAEAPCIFLFRGSGL